MLSIPAATGGIAPPPWWNAASTQLKADIKADIKLIMEARNAKFLVFENRRSSSALYDAAEICFPTGKLPTEEGHPRIRNYVDLNNVSRAQARALCDGYVIPYVAADSPAALRKAIASHIGLAE